MNESPFKIEQDLPSITIMSLTLKSRFLSEVPLVEKLSKDTVLLPNGKWVENRIGHYSVFSIIESESAEKMKIWSNGYDFLYKIDRVSKWHVWANFPEHMAKQFHVTSLDNGSECELWYLFKFTENLNNELFEIGGNITIVWLGEVRNHDHLYLSDVKYNMMIEFGNGFGIFLGDLYARYKKLYDSIRSPN